MPLSPVTRAFCSTLSTVLSDTQLDLLAQCLERGLLPQQLELVSTLE